MPDHMSRQAVDRVGSRLSRAKWEQSQASGELTPVTAQPGTESGAGVNRRKRVNRPFWSLVDSSAGPDACWPWLGRLDKDGYGLYGHGVRAHRLAHQLASGTSLGPGEVVRHSCDNPACANFAHLLRGTQADNVADAIARGRHVNPSRLGKPFRCRACGELGHYKSVCARRAA